MSVTIFSFKSNDDYRTARDIHVDQLEARGWKPEPDLDMWIQSEDANDLAQKLNQKGVEFSERPV